MMNLDVAFPLAQYGLQLNLLLLIDRASRMGAVEANTEATLGVISSTNTRRTIMLCLVLAGALAFAFGISLVLTGALQRLATGMDQLAMLQLDGLLDSVANMSRFSEVRRCELSFLSLKRSLSVLSRFPPFPIFLCFLPLLHILVFFIRAI